MSAHAYVRSLGRARNKTPYWCLVLCTLAVVHSGRKQPSNVRRDDYDHQSAQGWSCEANVYRVMFLEVKVETSKSNKLTGSIQKYQSRDVNGPVQVRLAHMIQATPHQHVIYIFFWIGPYGSLHLIHMDPAHP